MGKGRGDNEPLAHGIRDIIYPDGFGLLQQALLDNELESSGLDDFVGFVWLIQSQSQCGPPSTDAGDHYPQRLYLLPGLEELFDLLCCLLGYFEHSLSPFVLPDRHCRSPDHTMLWFQVIVLNEV